MKMAYWAMTLGAGMVAGAMAISMLPRGSETRKAFERTAHKVEQGAKDAADSLVSKMDM
ncbi:MAG: hypothetical protein LUH51_01605 [Firmicutes bacterium]|nr:hypothetical protein [Bacillota bacterium]